MNPKSPKGIVPRPPVVGIFGHIDHGKSTLLDYIRKTNITEKEAGGITQRISAYEVEHKTEGGEVRRITFLDTPGHEAFKAMRARGAGAADIGVLVVSAEDGVKPQTLEALSAILEAKIPYIIAINKIDKPQANVERAKQSLLENEIYIEGYGGTIPAVLVSAKTGVGVPELLDMILLVADIDPKTGNTEEPASGVVIESSLDTKKGVLATLIIKNGTLSKGSFVVAGQAIAPVRIMENFLGKAIQEATFASPVRIIGWSTLPKAGDEFTVVKSKKEAEEMVRQTTLNKKKPTEATAHAEGTIVIPIVIKADALGVAEAIVTELKKVETDKVKIKIVDVSAGTITETDLKSLSGTEGGIVIGFAVKQDARAKEIAERQNITIELFDVIYNISEYVAKIIAERTPKVETEEARGSLKVLRTFSRTKDKQVIGGKVETGKIGLGDRVKIYRRDELVGRGTIEELQVQKIKAREVDSGNECGLMVEAKVEIATGDRIESFTVVIK